MNIINSKLNPILISKINLKNVNGKYFHFLNFKYLHSNTGKVTVDYPPFTLTTLIHDKESITGILERLLYKAQNKLNLI